MAEKHSVALKIAEIIVDMAETRFSDIGGFASPTSHALGPTLEGSKLEISFVAEDEPFVLVHGDFHGRNIIMRGTQVQAVLDWEFAGAYPLGELL